MYYILLPKKAGFPSNVTLLEDFTGEHDSTNIIQTVLVIQHAPVFSTNFELLFLAPRNLKDWVNCNMPEESSGISCYFKKNWGGYS